VARIYTQAPHDKPDHCLLTASATFKLVMDGDSKKSLDEKHLQSTHSDTVAVSTKEVDTAAELSFGDGELDHAEALRVRCVVKYNASG
jgi:hypothetical protein